MPFGLKTKNVLLSMIVSVMRVYQLNGGLSMNECYNIIKQM